MMFLSAGGVNALLLIQAERSKHKKKKKKHEKKPKKSKKEKGV